MLCRLTCICLIALLLSCGRAGADFVQSGFNDVSGINGDGLANNSPFNVGNASLDGQGAGEPGWAGPWRMSVGAAVVGRTTYEGDGAAAFFQNTAAADRIVSNVPTSRFSIESRLMVPRSITRDVIFRVYDSHIADIFQAIAVQWAVLPDFTFYALDGIEDSCPTGMCNFENTGLHLTPGVWQLVRVEIDPIGRTWDFFVDGVHYDAPDPLGFRGVPTRLDSIQFLNEIAAPDGAYVDAVVVNTDLAATAAPEPASWALATVGLLALSVRRLCRRFGKS